MWSDYDKNPHRIRYATTVAHIQANRGHVPDSTNRDDLSRLKLAMEEYIRAKNDWTLSNTDETMIHLIGKWSRVSRIMREMDDKYGR